MKQSVLVPMLILVFSLLSAHSNIIAKQKVNSRNQINLEFKAEASNNEMRRLQRPSPWNRIVTNFFKFLRAVRATFTRTGNPKASITEIILQIQIFYCKKKHFKRYLQAKFRQTIIKH